MSTSPNLAIPHVVSNQNQKEVTINEAVDALDRALADALDLDLSAGSLTLTSAEFRGHLAFRATGLSEDRDLTVPAIRRLFVVINPSAAPTVHVRRGASTVAVGPGAAFILYADGTADGCMPSAAAAAGPAAPTISASSRRRPRPPGRSWARWCCRGRWSCRPTSPAPPGMSIRPRTTRS
jgi:hypothetical protein